MTAELPLIFDVAGLVEWFVEAGRGPSAGELSDACGRVGRNEAPALLSDLHVEGLLTPAAAVATVGDVWSTSEYPDRYLRRDAWRGLFRLAGYAVDGVTGERPTASLVLYRGSVPERRGDWSWTDNRQVAVGYAQGTRARRPMGKVWRAEVEPWRLLARNTQRDEHEYVVETDGLDIREDT